jgi:hypothetical protein
MPGSRSWAWNLLHRQNEPPAAFAHSRSRDPRKRIELRANAASTDYAPVASTSRNLNLWLPKSAVAYTHYDKRRTIIEHTFSAFQLFSVDTQQVIGKPKQPKDPKEKP